MRYLNRIILSSLLIILSGTLSAQAEEIDYTQYEQVLAGCVDGKAVDYEYLVLNRAPLDSFVMAISRVSYEQLGSMTNDERLAFWINAYNVLTLKAIIDVFPIPSIRAVKRYDLKQFKVAGRVVTLNQIRIEIIGDDLVEPLAYLVMTDGAASSPPLQKEPFRAEGLRERLQETARELFNNGKFIFVNPELGLVQVNQIFSWFIKPIVAKYAKLSQFKELEEFTAGPMNFIWTYADPGLREKLKQPADWKINMLSYQWIINANRRPTLDEPNRLKKPTK